MVTMELTEKMYYACGLCSTDSKVQWHRPGTKMWNDHREHIDLDETNSDRPKYFWCTHHRRPHDFKRRCLKYKAQITFNGRGGSNNRPTIQMSHNDVLPQIRKYVAEHSDAVNWKKVVGTKSLPWPCTRETRLLVPDIIYCKPDDSVKFRYSITNVIEFESETNAVTVADKVQRFNVSSRRMIEDGTQNRTVLPRIIFLYDRETRVSLEEVKRAVESVDTGYLDEVVVDYYDADGEWFEKLFLADTVDLNFKEENKMFNEVGMEVPHDVVLKAKEFGCIKGTKYVYKDGEYGRKRFPASSIGGTKATRFGNMNSAKANKVELGNGWVAFKSPTYGGVNIF